MFQSTIKVFKEIQLNNQVMFQHFRVGDEDEDYIVPDFVLTENEHWELLQAD